MPKKIDPPENRRVLSTRREDDVVAAIGAARELSAAFTKFGNDIRGLKRMGRRNRHLIYGIVLSLCFDFGITGYIYTTNHRTDAVAHEARKAALSNRKTCVAINEANSKNAGFWRTILTEFPVVPPGPDATKSERDAFARSQSQTVQFKKDVDELGRPKNCGA